MSQSGLSKSSGTTPSSGIIWQLIGANRTLSSNNGYVCTTGATLSLLLPPTSILGDIIEVTLDGSTNFIITQGAGQSIRFGSSTTTVGTGGSLASIVQGNALRMVCSIASTKWNILSTQNSFTVT